MSKRVSTIKLENVQILRAVAALLVVFCHGSVEAARFADLSENAILEFIKDKGLFGVDIFFVISGFIMFYINNSRSKGQVRPLVFLSDRIIRVVPLYWIVTSLSLGITLIAPSLKYHNNFDTGYILKSFMFIPAINPLTNAPEPVVGLGWTLNYEMFFYLIYAIIMSFFYKFQLIATALIFGCLVLIGFSLTETVFVVHAWCHTIILEFLFGMIIARLYISNFRIPISASFALGLLGVISWICVGPYQDGFIFRGVVWGGPAAIIVLAGVLVRSKPFSNGLTSSVLVKVGDCSYSLYLTHLFVIRSVSTMLSLMALSAPLRVCVFFLLFIPLAVVLALISRYLVELKLSRELKNFTSAKLKYGRL